MKKIFFILGIVSLGFVIQLPLFAKSKKPVAPPPYQAKAEIYNTDGRQIGRAVFFDMSDGVKMIVEVAGIPEGRHGIHIHEIGLCERPDFKSAGSHFNPTSKKHGFQNKSGPHAGDLPNLRVEDDVQTGRLEFVLTNLSLGEGKNSLFKTGGTSVVIHAAYDDDITDPAGNSGARIACGVIQPTF